MAKILFFLLLVISLFADQFYQRAERAFEDKVYKFAILSYQKEIDQNGSEKEESYYKIGLCYFYLKDYQKALKKFDEYIKLYSDGKQKINSQFYQANIFYLQKNYEGAINLIFFSLEKEKVSQKNKERFYFLISDIYFAQNELDLAIEELKKIEFYKNDLNARKGSLFYYLKNYSSALKFFDKIIEGRLFFNNKEKIIYEKIETLIQLKKYSLANKVIDQYLKENKKESSIYWNVFFLKNSINHYQKNYIESIQDMKKVIAKYTPLVEQNSSYKNLLLKSHLILIEDYLALNQKILALSVLKKALEDKYFINYRDELLWQKYEIYKDEKKSYDILKEIYQIYNQRKTYGLNYQIIIEKLATSPFNQEDNFKQLIKDYQKTKPTKKQKINFFKKLAVYLFENDNFKNSVNLFKKIYNLEPKLSTLVAIGETYIKNNESIRAIDFFSEIKLKGKQQSYQNDILGYSYLLNNDYLTSIEYYKKNVENKEYKKKSFFYIAENYFLINKYNEAIDYFKKFIQEKTEDTQYLHALYRIGFIYNHQKQYQESINFLLKCTESKIIDEFKNKGEVYYFLAKNFFELKKYSETLKYAKKVPKNNFYYYDSVFLMGNSYLLQKNEEGAKNSYFKIVNDDGAKQLIKNKSYYKLISFYLERKNFLQAEFYLEKMIFFEQNDSEYFDAALYKLIDFYYSNEKYSRINNLVERLQEIKTNKEVSLYLFYMQGMSELSLGNPKKTINIFEKAISNKENEVSKYYFEILYQLSLLYYDNENYLKAKKTLFLIENSTEEELRKEAKKIFDVVEKKFYLKEIQKKSIQQIANLQSREIPKDIRADVKLILAKKYFFNKQLQKSYEIVKKIKPNFGIKSNILNYFFLKFKLLYELKKYSDLYKEGLEFYYQYELAEDNRKQILLFYVSSAAYHEKLKEDGDFFFKELQKINKRSEYLIGLRKLRNTIK